MSQFSVYIFNIVNVDNVVNIVNIAIIRLFKYLFASLVCNAWVWVTSSYNPTILVFISGIFNRTQVCMEVPETECELVGYTECDSNKDSMPARDDKVVGEFFNEQDCSTRPITVTEMKMQPECVDQTKNSCEKMWIPEAPFWKDVNCQELTWQNCTLQPHPHPVQIDYCDCKKTEIWYNKFERVDSQCEKETTSCVEKAVPVCKSKPVTKCTTVSQIFNLLQQIHNCESNFQLVATNAQR